MAWEAFVMICASEPLVRARVSMRGVLISIDIWFTMRARVSMRGVLISIDIWFTMRLPQQAPDPSRIAEGGRLFNDVVVVVVRGVGREQFEADFPCVVRPLFSARVYVLVGAPTAPLCWTLATTLTVVLLHGCGRWIAVLRCGCCCIRRGVHILCACSITCGV
jgi:hypothetical protein